MRRILLRQLHLGCGEALCSTLTLRAVTRGSARGVERSNRKRSGRRNG